MIPPTFDLSKQHWHYLRYYGYYDLEIIRKQIAKYLINRELMLFHKSNPYAIRYLESKDFNDLTKYLKYYIRKPSNILNLYYSLAEFKEGSLRDSFNFLEYDKEEMKKNAAQNIVKYDFLLDIDAPSRETLIPLTISARKIKDFFDKLHVPYYLRFSGMGFHFVIPYDYIAPYLPKINLHPFSDYNIYAYFALIAKFLKEKFSEYICMNVYDYRRVAKIPYSISVYDEEDQYIVLPINSFEGFHPEKMHIKNVTFFPEDILHNPEGNCKFLVEKALSSAETVFENSFRGVKYK